MAIPVQVIEDNGMRLVTGDEAQRRLEAAVTIAQQDGDIIPVQVDRRQVLDVVTIQVVQGDVMGLLPAGY